MSSSTQSRAENMPVRNAASPSPSPSSTQATALAHLLRELRTQKHSGGSPFGASISSALEAVWANRTRSLLTMLGVVVGVAAVIGALTLTQGVGVFVTGQITSQGADLVYIQSGTANLPGAARTNIPKTQVQTLTLNDLQALQQLPHVAAISPLVSINNVQAVYGNQNWNTRAQGVSADLQTIGSWDLAQGLWFSNAQAVGAQPVAVIGDTVATNLFSASGVNPVGQQIRISNQLFRVVGVLAPKGGFRLDDIIYVPYQTALVRMTNQTYLNEIEVQADDPANIDLAVQEVTNTLERTHHIAKGNPDDFQTQTSAQLLQQASQATQAITWLLTGIAAISLTVGGIGIMNIMLVSVTERTREIGIRMSLGARRGDIRNQFLIESLFLCMAGGLLGLLVGILLGWVTIRLIVAALASSSGPSVPLIITPTTLLLPFVVAAVVGVVFGLYPAVRASRLDPIVALRRSR